MVAGQKAFMRLLDYESSMRAEEPKDCGDPALCRHPLGPHVQFLESRVPAMRGHQPGRIQWNVFETAYAVHNLRRQWAFKLGRVQEVFITSSPRSRPGDAPELSPPERLRLSATMGNRFLFGSLFILRASGK